MLFLRLVTKLVPISSWRTEHFLGHRRLLFNQHSCTVFHYLQENLTYSTSEKNYIIFYQNRASIQYCKRWTIWTKSPLGRAVSGSQALTAERLRTQVEKHTYRHQGGFLRGLSVLPCKLSLCDCYSLLRGKKCNFITNHLRRGVSQPTACFCK